MDAIIESARGVDAVEACRASAASEDPGILRGAIEEALEHLIAPVDHKAARDVLESALAEAPTVSGASGMDEIELLKQEIEGLKVDLLLMWQAGLKLADYGRTANGRFPADAERIFRRFDPECWGNHQVGSIR